MLGTSTPSVNSALPIPVPSVSSTTVPPCPLPAPSRISARPAASASFSTVTGRPVASAKSLRASSPIHSLDTLAAVIVRPPITTPG